MSNIKYLPGHIIQETKRDFFTIIEVQGDKLLCHRITPNYNPKIASLYILNKNLFDGFVAFVGNPIESHKYLYQNNQTYREYVADTITYEFTINKNGYSYKKLPTLSDYQSFTNSQKNNYDSFQQVITINPKHFNQTENDFKKNATKYFQKIQQTINSLLEKI